MNATKLRSHLPEAAFTLLFAAQMTFYLLILQTGIVEFHHSEIREIWMVPVGGVIGILTSIYAYRHRSWLLPALLMAQTFFSFHYAHDDGMDMFTLGLISGLTAPMLIARIERLLPVAIALGLSYIVGSANFDLPPDGRTGIAVLLSTVAFVAALMADIGRPKSHAEHYSLSSTTTIFFWLILDAALFETLSRNTMMHIWGEPSFTPLIIIFHLVGVATAYRFRHSRYNDLVILLLFGLTYTIYSLQFQMLLALLYPFVISYYNVIILERFRKIHYPNLAFAALSLWIASGFGLMIALAESFSVAWTVLALLGLIYLIQRNEHA